MEAFLRTGKSDVSVILPGGLGRANNTKSDILHMQLRVPS